MDNAPLFVIFVYPCYTFVIPLPKGYTTFDYLPKVHFIKNSYFLFARFKKIY